MIDMMAADYLGKRTESHLSQAEVARRTGFSRTHVIKVETGRSRASASYEVKFLNAVDPYYKSTDISSLTRMPAKRAQRMIANATAKLDAASVDLSRMRGVLDLSRETISIIIEQGKILTDGAVELVCGFDPRTANDDDQGKVTEFICNVILEMVVDHKFHLLNDAEIDQRLGAWSKHVAREAKKLRNRRQFE